MAPASSFHLSTFGKFAYYFRPSDTGGGPRPTPWADDEQAVMDYAFSSSLAAKSTGKCTAPFNADHVK
jgi:hypothetical protein